MNDQRMYQQMSGRYRDPSVDSADDAVVALKKRADCLRAKIAEVPNWQAELARIESMLKASG